jgi:hypothetical protein
MVSGYRAVLVRAVFTISKNWPGSEAIGHSDILIRYIFLCNEIKGGFK